MDKLINVGGLEKITHIFHGWMDDVGHFLAHFTVPGTPGTWGYHVGGHGRCGPWGWLAFCRASQRPIPLPSCPTLRIQASLPCQTRLHSVPRQRNLADCWMFGRCLEYFVEDHTTILNLDKMPGHEEFLVSSLWDTQRRSGNWGSVKELTLWQCPEVTSSSWRTVSLACCWLSSNLPVRSRIQPVALVSHHQPKLRMGTYYII